MLLVDVANRGYLDPRQQEEKPYQLRPAVPHSYKTDSHGLLGAGEGPRYSYGASQLQELPPSELG